MRTFAALAKQLRTGQTSSQQLIEECLERIADPAGEGERAFLSVDAVGARATARALDGLRGAGAEPSPWAGIPVSIKDLFDVRGQVTRAGSRVLSGPAATQDAPAVARLRAAGLVVIGRTNMTEFAYSGVGLNPHYGTPANPWDRPARRIPGGSTSGGAVSVADQLAFGALGSDTGGSCRIPAALCGLVGFKPTQDRVPRAGSVPLSPSLDTVVPLAATVECVCVLDALLRGAPPVGLVPPVRPPARLIVACNYLFDGIDDTVAADFDRLLRRLRDAGADIHEVTIPALDTIPEMTAGGGFPAAEAYAWHQELLATSANGYDTRVRSRIERGARLTARDLVVLQRRRRELIDAVTGLLETGELLLCPTVPIVAPTVDELSDDEDYTRINLLMLRNPTFVNLIDGCAVSVPMHQPGQAPTGAMVAGSHGTDDSVLRTAAWIKEHT